MNYLDTGILISAIYLRDSNQEKCSVLLKEGVTSTHALAEVFAALTGQYRVKNDIVSEALPKTGEGIEVLFHCRRQDILHQELVRR
ncbi:MAG: hypothetical protein JWM99_536 [Verrucomicrobiales bacterium]|nr:hypothetical protein [Verrucomicrobiales bacterium]